MAFHMFHDLAPELRLKIFTYAIPTPHIVPLKVAYTDVDSFKVSYDEDTNSDFLPFITKTSTRGLSHTCRELRGIYINLFPDRIVLESHGVIWLNYQTSIVYLGSFDELIAQPEISHFLFNQQVQYDLTDLNFPQWFAKICQLALSLDCILEYPENSPHIFSPMSLLIESALFAKMLQPFRNLTHLWAVAEEYWKLDISLILQGYFQPYPGELNISVLGRLAERKEQLALWADYKNDMLQAKKTAKIINEPDMESVHVPPKLMIWDMEELELWDYLLETCP